MEGARWLQRAGASCIAVPCNTAHAYAEQLSKATGVEVLDMISAALDAAARRTPGLERVGVLATRGTRLTRLYERAGARLGLDVLQVPDPVQEEYVDAAIRAVKSGADPRGPERWIALATDQLRDLGAQAVVAACTEIPLISASASRVLPLVDSTDALAEAAVSRLWRPASGPTAVRTRERTG